jgi:hypothetical protein
MNLCSASLVSPGKWSWPGGRRVGCSRSLGRDLPHLTAFFVIAVLVERQGARHIYHAVLMKSAKYKFMPPFVRSRECAKIYLEKCQDTRYSKEICAGVRALDHVPKKRL